MVIQSNIIKYLIKVCFGESNSYLRNKVIYDINNKENWEMILFDRNWFP